MFSERTVGTQKSWFLLPLQPDRDWGKEDRTGDSLSPYPSVAHTRYVLVMP